MSDRIATFRILGPFLLVALALAGAALVGNRLATQTAKRTLEDRATASARIWLRYFSRELGGFEQVLEQPALADRERAILDEARRFVDVFLSKLFDAQGRLLILSDDIDADRSSIGDLATHNAVAAEILRSGAVFTEVFDGSQKPDRPDRCAESYLPILQDGHKIGVVEV
jgi:hypothetical protein